MTSGMPVRSEWVSTQMAAISAEESMAREHEGLQRVKVPNLKLVKVDKKSVWGALVYFTRDEQQLHRVRLSINDDVIIEPETDSDLPILNYSIKDIYSNNRAPPKVQGVVNSITTKHIAIIVKTTRFLNQSYPKYRLRKVTDGVTYDRLKKALTDLEQPSPTYHQCNLDHIYFGETPVPETKPPKNVTFFNAKLDQTQKDAVRFALAQEKLCLIYGPPGTGKTTTIIEILMQLNKQDKRVLVCSPSNNAVDNIMEKLKDEEVKGILRLGNPARAHPGLEELTLEVVLRKRLPNGVGGFHRGVRHRELQKAEQQTIQAGHILYNEFLSDSSQALIEVLKTHKIIFSTLTSASPYEKLGYLINGARERFDVIIIDESSQALQAACWIALPLAKKAILVGDPKQLAPTVLDKSLASVLEKSPMHFFAEIEEFTKKSTDLRHQYRMHEDIMKWSSYMFYNNVLVADDSVKHRKLDEISKLKNWPPLLLVDTRGCCFYELPQDESSSCANEHEVEIVYNLVSFYVRHGVSQEDIGVITPYKLQVKFIMSRLEKFPQVRVKTVDGFQGREKEVIIISFVRSNSTDQVGFLCDRNRINVAVTRAKRHLAIVADSYTVAADSTIESLISYLNEKAKEKKAVILNGKTFERSLNNMQYGSGDQTKNSDNLPSVSQTQLNLTEVSQKLNASNLLNGESDEDWNSPPGSPCKKRLVTSHNSNNQTPSQSKAPQVNENLASKDAKPQQMQHSTSSLGKSTEQLMDYDDEDEDRLDAEPIPFRIPPKNLLLNGSSAINNSESSNNTNESSSSNHSSDVEIDSQETHGRPRQLNLMQKPRL